MDPDTALAVMLEMAAKIVREEDSRSGAIVNEDAYRLAEHTLALDEWLRHEDGGKDGFLPKRWQTVEEKAVMLGIREYLIGFRDACLGRDFDAEGAITLSHAIAWLGAKAEGKSYDPTA